MAEAGYGRPSEILNGRLGDAALDAEVFRAASKVKSMIVAAVRDDPEGGETAVIRKLRLDAKAEQLYAERHKDGG